MCNLRPDSSYIKQEKLLSEYLLMFNQFLLVYIKNFDHLQTTISITTHSSLNYDETYATPEMEVLTGEQHCSESSHEQNL